MRLHPILLSLCLASSVTAVFAGEVQLPDGRLIYGDVKLTADGKIEVTPAGEKAESFSIDGISRAVVSPAVAGEGAWPWVGSDIGAVRNKGEVKQHNGVFDITASGWGVWSGVDSGYFLSRKMEGDGQIIARVQLPESVGSRSVGGLMFRASNEPDAPFAAVTLGPKGPPKFLSRPTAVVKLGTPPPPEDPAMDTRVTTAWLRLTRAGDTFTAYASADGSNWQTISTLDVKMNASASVGLLVSSDVNMPTGPVRFDHLATAVGAPATTSIASPLPAKGVITVDGKSHVGDVTAISEDTITLERLEGKSFQLKTDDVAWIFVAQTFPNVTPQAGSMNAGVLLKTGDFLEAESITLTEGTVTATSIVFGPKTLDLKKEVDAILLRPIPNWANQWHVRDAAGSVVSSEKPPTVEGGDLIVGDANIAMEKVTEIFAPKVVK